MEYPKILVTKNNDNLSLLLGNKHYLFQGSRVQALFEAALDYKQCLCEGRNIDTSLSYLQELISPILRKDIAKYFTTDGHYVYLGQTEIPVPESLFNLINNFIEKGYNIDAFANFWRFCLMNPNQHARDRFFEYCQTYGITITDKGYAVLYKAVNNVKRSKVFGEGLTQFVSESYLKVKRWKKSPFNYFIYKDKYNSQLFLSDKELHNAELVGNLKDLHSNIDELVEQEGVAFRPGHTGQHGMDIQLGKVVTMPREECDSNIKNECSYGLHVGSFKYVSSFGRGMDTILAVLVNPMDIVALPEYDNSKIRCCKYMPYAIIERDENNQWTEIDSEIFEEDYILQEDEALLEVIKNNPSKLTQQVVNQIISTIPAAKSISYDDYGYNDDYDDDYDDDLEW
jgi:hypothetical protein